MALQPWRKGIVTRIAEETYNTRRYWIQIPELPSFDFTPGQFVTLDLPIDEKPGRRLRSYSIASWPDGTNTIELVIVLLEGGAGTTYLFNEVKEGAELCVHSSTIYRYRPDADLHGYRHSSLPQHDALYAAAPNSSQRCFSDIRHPHTKRPAIL
jgi:hypothetical protein